MIWELWAYCGECEYLLEKPTHGNVWFTKQHLPVCPECGAYSSGYETVRAKVRHGRIIERRKD